MRRNQRRFQRLDLCDTAGDAEKRGARVLRHRAAPVWEPLWDPATIDDEMNAQVLRLGAGQTVAGPSPKRSGGYYVFVASGSMVHEGENMPDWSMIVVENSEDEFEITAGKKGLEALVLEYPRETQD